MSHVIKAFQDPSFSKEISCLQLFPSQGFIEGNIYDVLNATNYRRSCSGNGVGTEFVLSPDFWDIILEGRASFIINEDSLNFLKEISQKLMGNRRILRIRFD